MKYLVGDVQGCCAALQRMLDTIGFSPSRDRLVVLGDLVNRGPQSLATLRLVHSLGDSAACVLGNHDLHLLAVACGGRKGGPKDTLADVLDSPERSLRIDWLRSRPMAMCEDGWLLVHAGVAPQWDVARVLALAGEVEGVLRGPGWQRFLHVMYGDEPLRWDETLAGDVRLRFIVNALTRMRFCAPDGTLELDVKDSADAAPKGYMPWFDVPGRRTEGVPIAFGHWSALGLVERPDLLALDTGCVWGGKLTAVRIDGGRREIVQVPCAQAQRTGD